MGAVKMTSGPDSRFPMTLERPVHHPLWPHARFHGSDPDFPGKGSSCVASKGTDLQETAAPFFERARRRRRGKKGKMEEKFFSALAATYSSFDALPPSFPLPISFARSLSL